MPREPAADRLERAAAVGAVELQRPRRLEGGGDERAVGERVVDAAVDDQGERVAVAVRVSGAHRAEPDRGARALGDEGRDRIGGDERGGTLPERAAPGVGLELERAEPHHVAVRDEEPRERRHLGEVAVEHRGVEDDRERQPASALDVLAAQRVELDLGVVAPAALGQVDVEGHVGEPGRGELGEQRRATPDAVGEERRAHAAVGDPPHDRRPARRAGAGSGRRR